MYPTHPRSPAGTKPASIALVGAGEFGATFAAQIRRIPDLRLRLVCDRDAARSESALLRAGYAASEIAFCSGRAAILAAMERGQVAVVDDLALEVGQIDHIVVDHSDRSDARRRQIKQQRRAEPSGAHHQHTGVQQLFLTDAANFGKDDVAGVAFDLGVREIHRS